MSRKQPGAALHVAEQRDLSQLVARTLRVWQPRTTRPLDVEDARQIAANMSGFISVLSDWSRRLKAGVNTSGSDGGRLP